MDQHGNLLASGTGKHNMNQFYFQVVFSVILVIVGLVLELWTTEALVGIIAFFAIIDILTFVWYFPRARTNISVFENGVSGSGMTGVMSAKAFSLPYDQISNVEPGTKRVVVYAKSGGKYTCHAANSDQLQTIIKERLQARNSSISQE